MFDPYFEFKKNYYALLLSIYKNKSAKEALMAMGISPDNE